MWGRKKKTTSVAFGDPNNGFMLTLCGEGVSNSGIGLAFDRASALRLEDGSRRVQLGDGSPGGHQINMSVITAKRDDRRSAIATTCQRTAQSSEIGFISTV